MSGAGRVRVVGGGVDGLVCALLLARRGRVVTVLEARPEPGGLAAPLTVGGAPAPPPALHDDVFPEGLARELGLAGHGLAWEPAPPLRVVAGAGSDLMLPARPWSRPGEVAAGPGWPRLAAVLERAGAALAGLVEAPAPDPLAPGLGGVLGLLGAGARLRRRLGRAELAALARLAPAPLADVAEDHGLPPLLAAGLAGPALLGTFAAPHSPLTGLSLLLRAARESDRRPAAGSGALVAALVRAARAAGVELRTGTRVAAVLLRGERVAGVRLADGEELAAPVVVATCDPRRTFLELLPARDLPPDLTAAAERWRGRGTVAVLGLRLDGPEPWLPAPAGGGDGPVLVAAGLDDLQRAFEPVKYGRIPERPFLLVREAAGEGCRVLTVHAAHVPAAPVGGWTPELRGALVDRILARLEEAAPWVRRRVRERRLLVAPDLDAEYGLVGGHLLHGEEAPDQLLAFRPSLACSGHRTPVPGLFLGGAGSHPGPPGSGRSGRLAARAVLATTG